MRTFIATAAAAVVLALPFAAQAAHHHSPAPATAASMPACAAGDPVVWINTKSNVYHAQSDRYFGKTKAGKYACQSAAVAAGAKAAGTGAAMHGHAAASAMPSAMPVAKHHHRRGHDASPAPAASATP